MWWFRFKHNINDTNITLKPGSHKPAGRPTWDIAASTAWDNAAAYVNIFFYRRHNLSRALTAGLPAKLSWVASWRLSAMKIFYVNIICGDLQRYATTKSQVGRRHMRTRLKGAFLLQNPRLDSKIQKWILRFFTKQINPTSLGPCMVHTPNWNENPRPKWTRRFLRRLVIGEILDWYVK